MTEEFTKDDSARALTPVDVQMADVLSDPTFNSRGVISPFDVRELAIDIQEHGLQNPIHITPYPIAPYRYRILAGHRRFAAYQMAQLQLPESQRKTTIPAVVKYGMSEIDQLAYNLLENIKRSDLNILQEARALEKFKFAGYTDTQVAQLLSMSRGWVQIRFMLLDLPEDIQTEAAAGVINNVNIRQLYSLVSVAQEYDLIRQIKDQVIKCKARPPKLKVPAESQAKARTRAEINAIQMIIFDTLGASFTTKMLGWAQGEVDDRTMYYAIKEEADKHDRYYTIPPEYR